MPKPPAISVIMPCFNEGARITQSIDSVFKQTFSDLELIVIDDGSSDNSVEILNDISKTHPALKVLKQDNKGPGPARNYGLREAKGNFVAFLDADDSWHEECLAKLHDKLTASPNAAIVYCGWQNIGLSKNRCKPYIPPDYEQPEKIETLLRGCRWPIHAALTRRNIIEKRDGFDEQLSSCMDYDLWLHIASFNTIVRVPEVLAYYHHHGGEQITKNRLRIALNHSRIQEKFIREFPSIAEQLGDKKVKEIIDGELLHRAYISYWDRDLNTAYPLFRKMLFHRYYKRKDLKYLLPALLPFEIYKALIGMVGK